MFGLYSCRDPKTGDHSAGWELILTRLTGHDILHQLFLVEPTNIARETVKRLNE